MFGFIVGDGFDVPQIGLFDIVRAVRRQIIEIQIKYTYLILNKFVIMPNYYKNEDYGNGTSKPSPTNALIPLVISSFK